MKCVIISVLIALFTVAAYNHAAAQETKPQPFWVIESNVKTPKQSVVYFYTADHVLMYKEAVQGKKLNVNRRKVVQHLNAVLHEAETAWQNQKEVKPDAQQLAKRL